MDIIQRIKCLPSMVANQIAAGEVIERPASVVKELLENAWDAGANSICIDIGFGGLNQIKISDNGSGILAEDLPLAILAHATSKITTLDDLYAIRSLGFRGEALASIAAVSRLSIVSQTAAQSHASQLQVEPGKEAVLFPTARNQGTTVEVRDLFFNVPVRKSFLKTEKNEYQAIESVVKRFALSAPTMALTLTHNEKEMLRVLPARCEQTNRARIRAILGKAFIENAYYLDIEQGGVRLYGWVSGEGYQRSQSDRQWVYLNQRMVKDPLIHHAIKQAYGDHLYPGRYPVCLLYLTMPAQDVDVNVHPTKYEVRFKEPRWIHDFIYFHLAETITRAFEESKKVATMEISTPCPRSPMADVLTLTEPVSPLFSTWFSLNNEFACLKIQGQPYLVDIQQAEQQRLVSIMQHQSLPFENRPLLVPIHCSIDKTEVISFEKKVKLLSEMGLELDWVGETHLLLRTLPLFCSQLNVKQWWEALKQVAPNHSALLCSLVRSQLTSTLYWSEEQKNTLLAYIQENIVNADKAVAWCVGFNLERCRAILYA